MRSRLAALALAAVALAACGGGDGAEEVVAETAANLRDVESGVVSMRLRIAPKAEDGQPLEVELRGPFSFADAARLPVARMVYSELRGRRRDATTVLATERGVYAEVRGQAYKLPADQAARLGRVREVLAEGEWRRRLRLEHWIEGAHLSGGGAVDGVPIELVEGTLDMAAVAEDLVELERLFGGGRDVDAELIEAATRSTAVRLFTGERDRVLRRLEVDLDLGFEVPSPLRRTLGVPEGARIYFELSVTDVNRPLSFAEPRSVRPSSGLPTR